jgi:hypothetical protein
MASAATTRLLACETLDRFAQIMGVDQCEVTVPSVAVWPFCSHIATVTVGTKGPDVERVDYLFDFDVHLVRVKDHGKPPAATPAISQTAQQCMDNYSMRSAAPSLMERDTPPSQWQTMMKELEAFASAWPPERVKLDVPTAAGWSDGQRFAKVRVTTAAEGDYADAVFVFNFASGWVTVVPPPTTTTKPWPGLDAAELRAQQAMQRIMGTVAPALRRVFTYDEVRKALDDFALAWGQAYMPTPAEWDLGKHTARVNLSPNHTAAQQVVFVFDFAKGTVKLSSLPSMAWSEGLLEGTQDRARRLMAEFVDVAAATAATSPVKPLAPSRTTPAPAGDIDYLGRFNAVTSQLRADLEVLRREKREMEVTIASLADTLQDVRSQLAILQQAIFPTSEPPSRPSKVDDVFDDMGMDLDAEEDKDSDGIEFTD